MRGDPSALFANWAFWALLSAIFAALTAIFAKVGVEGVDSDLATLARTLVVAVALALLLAAAGRLQFSALPARTWTFLALSGLATGASWLCYFRALKIGEASQVAPVDKLSVVLVALFGAVFLGEKLSSLNWVGVGLISAGALLVALR
jgi:bacterial/archaeal transporter family protein